MTHGEPTPEHPSSEAIADFINGRLSGDERSKVASHLAECRSCRQQVVSTRRLLDTYEHRRPLKWAIPSAAALVLIVIAFRVSPRAGVSPRAPASVALRGHDGSIADGRLRLSSVAPSDGDTATNIPVTFVWRGQPGQPLFRLALIDGARELWSLATSDTTARLPDAVPLVPGREYSWYVDAVGADGRSLTTGTQHFRVKP